MATSLFLKKYCRKGRFQGFQRFLAHLLLIGSLLSCFFVSPGYAQEAQPDGPVYIVQPGDSLWDIAQRFGVSMDDLAGANGITDPSQLAAGAQLVIPGLPGVTGILETQPVSFGDTFYSLSREYHLPAAMLARLNHISSPAQVYAGYNLVIPAPQEAQSELSRTLLSPGQSLLELSALQGLNPWSLVATNQFSGTWDALPGSLIYYPTTAESEQPADKAVISGIVIDPLPMLQGKVSEIKISAQPGLTLKVSFMGHESQLYPDENGDYIALQGVHALADPGLYPLSLDGQLPGGAQFEITQNVRVSAVDYPYDRPLTVNPTTIDPAVTKPEDAEWTALAQPVTPERLWSGTFGMPTPLDQNYCVETGECWSSRFGNRRSYNGGPYNAFHTGLDIVGTTGTEIYAPAAGIVVFTGPLTVRGNATMINHGWGIYSGYMHQSEVYVKVGDRVEKGQLIGLVGATGRVEGPHLHWEVWAGGVQVDPLDWLTHTYP